MRLVKVGALLGLWVFFFAAVALAHAVASVFRLPGRWRRVSRLMQRFARLLRVLLRIRVSLEGEVGALGDEGALVTANHVSYVDGIVLGSLFPVIFVSKKEVRGWPVVGQWTALCGTIFIDRQKKDKTPAVVEEIAAKLRQGVHVLLFPEGTSTNGEAVLPFQSAPFAAPLRTRAAVIPVTLTYTAIDREPVTGANRDRVYWYADMEFLGHFWRLLGLRNVEVSVRIHPRIDTSRYRNDSQGRKDLSQACYDRILGRPAIPARGTTLGSLRSLSS
ncbi:MAG: 1-acyl-sn-glycerol-3-phosphate acyltransferase [Deltaproteobacteria bacterium]|nr:1-acyl-sn-glycerol-3-phosphate acyltransferase [Deltaproteobacteria bacterium]